jgi:hypothetical protein
METQANEPSNTSETADAGLLDSATLPDDKQGQQETERATIDHKAPEAKDEPLERPEWWPENFWKGDEPDLEGIAKSWGDLRKQIAQGKHKPPADGKYDTSAFGSVPEDNPIRNHVLGWAKEYGISQSALDKLVGDVVAMQGEQVAQTRASYESERKALGPNADVRIRGMTDWAVGLVQKGVWSKDDFDEFKVMAGTARGINVMEKLRGAMENYKVPTGSVPVEGAPSKEELYQMVADPRYSTDPAYRKKVENLFQQTFSSE